MTEHKKPMEKSAKPHVASHPAAGAAKSHRYVEAVGRRKTATARVRISMGTTGATVNGKAVKDYFVLPKSQRVVMAPMELLKLEGYGLTAKVNGGGIMAQAEAIRHGLSRAIVKVNAAFLKRLRVAGFLTRDSRMVERKKYGLKKASRSPQWAKR